MPPATRRRSLLTRTPVPALAVATLVALVLWGLVFWSLGHTAAQAFTAPTVTAEVGPCPTDLLGPGCTVSYTDPAGEVRSRAIDRPGLVGVSSGDQVPLWVAADGTVGVAGWRAWIDSLILVALAAGMTSTAVGWLRKALRHGDVVTIFDLGEDEGEGRGRLRRIV